MQGVDAKLVQSCMEGDARAWESFIRTYSGRLINMAYRYTNSYSVAEELTQDVFLKIYQNLSSFRPSAGSLQSWVMRVGRNLVIDHYRSHKKEKNVAGSEELEVMELGAAPKTASPFESLYLREKAEFLQSGLAQLSPELKEAILLRDLEGFAYQEIAEMLEIPEGTVKSRINRGRIELAKVLRRMKGGQVRA
ncbi:MAG: sigma-70 family RNA polymerase sigma factor [Acidobacteriota bacterium]|nr:MAG: sigma-70 family RNA polymerase sigma factor [Acidobacteriota bacterium]